MQTSCLRLMGKKLLVALTLEGKFAGEGLHDVEEDDDMLAAMARELVQQDGIGETADAIWSQLKEVYDQLPTASCETPIIEEEERVFEDPEGTVPVDELPWSDISQPVLVPESPTMTLTTLFGQPFPSATRKGKRTRETDPLQGSLFSWN